MQTTDVRWSHPSVLFQLDRSAIFSGNGASLTQNLEGQRREQDEKDRNQILESHYCQVAKDTSDLVKKRRVSSITQRGSFLDLKKKESRLEADLSLNVDCSDASSFSLHLLHPLLSQVKVSLQMVADQRQPQHTRGHDDPQAHTVEGSTGNAACGRRPR